MDCLPVPGWPCWGTFFRQEGKRSSFRGCFLEDFEGLTSCCASTETTGSLENTWGPGILSCLPLLSPWPGKQKYDKVRARTVLSVALPAAGEEECADKESPSPLHICCCWAAASAPCSVLPLLCCAHHFSIMVNSQNLTVQAFHNRACHHIRCFFVPLLVSDKNTVFKNRFGRGSGGCCRQSF